MTWYALFPLFCYVVFFGVYFKLRQPGRLNILDFSFFFLTLGYGPHTLFDYGAWMPLTYGNTTSENWNSYYQALSFAFLGLAAGLFVGRILSPNAFSNYTLNTDDHAHFNKHIGVFYKLAIAYLVMFAVVSIALDANAFVGRILETLKYLLNMSVYSYEEIRRELFINSPSTGLMASTRYSITAAVLALLFATHFMQQKKYPFLWFLILGIYIVCAITLNKLVFFYYLLLLFLVWLFKAQMLDAKTIKTKFILLFVLMSLFMFALIVLLYSIQYRVNIETGLNSYQDFMQTTISRTFLPASEGMLVWLIAYPEYLSFTGINNIGLIANLLGLPIRDPSVETVVLMMGANVNTTLQPGYMASAYASFGMVGILLNSIIIGLMITWWESVKHKMPSSFMAIAYCAAMSMGSYYLISAQYHTSLLTGGGLLTPLFFIALTYILPKQVKAQT